MVGYVSLRFMGIRPEGTEPMTTLVLSDLHLGARNSRTDLLDQVLRADCDQLILNGDTVDGSLSLALRSPIVPSANSPFTGGMSVGAGK